MKNQTELLIPLGISSGRTTPTSEDGAVNQTENNDFKLGVMTAEGVGIIQSVGALIIMPINHILVGV